MKRFRKVLVALSVIMAVSAIQVPASAGPAEDTVCFVTTVVTKYGWGFASGDAPIGPICL